MFILDFSFFLTLVVGITGLLTLLDVLVCSPRRKKHDGKQPLWAEYARAFFPVLFLVWGLRSFVIQPNYVPTSSLVPTVLPGDLIAVKEYEYGLRLPVINKKIVNISEPKRGQIALFHHPLDPKMTLIKRVIGLPGDHIVYRNKKLYINGQEMRQKRLAKTSYIDDTGIKHSVYRVEENLDGVIHNIFVDTNRDEMHEIASPYNDVIVPPGHYFMMGDNRDDSGDSRVWGFVPERNLIGQAFVIWMSWDKQKHDIRWQRIGTWLTPNKVSQLG